MEPKAKIHPHKFTLWVGIGSIVMMFAGLTSAYIVKRDQPNWTGFRMPVIFWYSTAVLLLSSAAIQLGIKAFKSREMPQYRSRVLIAAVLGLLFFVMQIIGFANLWGTGVHLRGAGGGQFLYVIFGLHAIHVLGGVVALFVLLRRTFTSQTRNYSIVPIEVTATYWHFVDFLWIYLFVFFLWIQ